MSGAYSCDRFVLGQVLQAQGTARDGNNDLPMADRAVVDRQGPQSVQIGPLKHHETRLIEYHLPVKGAPDRHSKPPEPL